MTQELCLYPYHLEARKLPVYLTGIGSTAYQQPISRPEGYYWHQLLFCTEGRGVLTCGEETHPIAAGDCFFLPAGHPHAYHAENSRWSVQWLTFDGYALPQLLSQLGMTAPHIVHAGSTAAFQSLFSRMVAAQTSDRFFGDYACSGLVYSYILEFHRLMLTVTDARNQLLIKVLNHIDQAYPCDISLQQLSDIAGVTPQHLCRVFRDALHMRPGEYITQRRIRAAQELIQTTELPLAEIAGRVGFSSAGYFSTVFRRYVGIAPSSYRSHAADL